MNKQDEINNLPSIILDVRAKDLTNKRQGNITFLKPAEKINKRIYWWVICDCGNIEKVRADSRIQRCKECNKIHVGQLNKGKNLSDLTNKKFGRLTALFVQNDRKNGNVMWHCKCDCGNELDVQSTSLTSGNTQSCGCQKREHAYFATLKQDLIGQKFGYLTVLEETNKREYDGKVVWKCQCECGKIVYLNTNRLKSGNDTSCGCKKQSLGMLNIQKLLSNAKINYKKEYRFDDYSNRRYDFAIFNRNNEIIRLIEFDGEQHYRTTGGWNNLESLKKNKLHDKEKNEYALSHNIPLVRIPYWERDNITLEMLLGDKYLI